MEHMKETVSNESPVTLWGKKVVLISTPQTQSIGVWWREWANNTIAAHDVENFDNAMKVMDN